ncbi:LOW QUALITY PROTEIN: hypothetical protein TorRG33x02_247370 [Trema orientale]|uniref:Uncharacterized protein n=1 Tax=Trema orientale TaxID=63057 RepID=A0A2P5DMF8_TREOI|nr:LOW QUALITY PROTEIN: hypothetical protein TorRG33x02_247370 [Trema orientale]
MNLFHRIGLTFFIFITLKMGIVSFPLMYGWCFSLPSIYFPCLNIVNKLILVTSCFFY